MSQSNPLDKARSTPVLVAHRGDPGQFPENTLEGISASLEAGACYVEFDIQLSTDEVPLVIHDDNLLRTAEINISVLETEYAELKQHSVGEPTRFGHRFSESKLPTLAETISLLKKWPKAEAFVEIKRASIRHFEQHKVMESVFAEIKPYTDQCIVISFDYDFVCAVKQASSFRVGWVLHEYSNQTYEKAKQLNPDFLFCKEERLPSSGEPLWAGDWKWCIYEISDPEQALELTNQRGIELIETNNITEMLQHPLLLQKACTHD